jgi:hypothetical protein
MANIILKLRLIHDDEYVEPLIFDSYKALADYASQLDDSAGPTFAEEEPEKKEFLTNPFKQKIQEAKNEEPSSDVEAPPPPAKKTKKSNFWSNLK